MLTVSCVLCLLLPVAIFLYRKWKLFAAYAAEIDKIPGPKSRFYFGNALEFYNLKSEDILQKVIKDFELWGPTFRYWFSNFAVVLVSDVDDVKTILTGKSNQEKGILYEYLKPWLGTGLLTSSGDKWKFMRRIITPTFHFSILRKYIPVFTKNAKMMMELLKREESENNACELSDYVTYCALDSICGVCVCAVSKTSMGKFLNCQSGKSETGYVSAIFRIGQIVVERLFSPFLHSDWMFYLSSLGRENRRVLRVLHGVTSKLIQERKRQFCSSCAKVDDESPGNGYDDDRKHIPFLDLLIEKQKIYSFSDLDLREEVDTILMAVSSPCHFHRRQGHDTTSTALNWCFFELGLRDDIQDNVHKELDGIFRDSDRSPTHQDLIGMDYLRRVLQETLRLYPSAPVISRKFDVDLQLKNHRIPANTEIVLLLYHIHRNPNIFPKPEVFDPDRFLPVASNSRDSFAYVPFSAGSRNCLGQKYAMLQMLVLSSYILRRYTIKTLNKRESVKAVPDVILRPNVKLRWKLIPRTRHQSPL